MFHGEIAAVDSRVDPVTRTVQVRALIDNPQRLLRPGLLMRVELLRNPRDAVMIPESALLHRGAEHSVLVVATGADGEPVAEERQVEIGLRRPGEVEITGGLRAGDQVLTHGADKARAGQPVRIRGVDDGTLPVRELLAQPAGASAEGGEGPR
jgi:membrane fusion protein (multidrug efflux system)